VSNTKSYQRAAVHHLIDQEKMSPMAKEIEKRKVQAVVVAPALTTAKVEAVPEAQATKRNL